MANADSSQITTPEQHFGFAPGTDRKLIRWPAMLDYFRQLSETSDRIRYDQFGVATEGQPLVVLTISSPENLARLDELQAIQQRLIDPRGLETDEAERLLAEGRSIVLVECSIHPTEVGASQMAPALVYELATRDDDEMLDILDKVVLLLIPSLNPDGMELVGEWYESTLNTPAEGTWPPSITHKYAGGENNRDWFMLTQAENRLFVSEVYNQWFPHLIVDLHQMDPDSFRFVLPPYVDPIDPNVDPLIVAESSRVGMTIAAQMTAAGLPGVATQVLFDAYSPDRNYAQYHAGVYILTECASCDVAAPIEVNPATMRVIDGSDARKTFARHPYPWRGGTWSLSDIVAYDRQAVIASLIDAARNRGDYLRNLLTVQRRAVDEDSGRAFVIPAEQVDDVAVAEMIDVLRAGQVEVHQATDAFVAGGVHYPAGSYIVPLAQPFGGYARTLLEARNYPPLYLYPGGPPRPPYDMSTSSLPLLMGVRVDAAAETKTAAMQPITEVTYPAGVVHGDGPVYITSSETNASARAVNALLSSGATIQRATNEFQAEGTRWPAGTFIAEGVERSALSAIASETHTVWYGLAAAPVASGAPIRLPRVGVYKSYMTGFGVCDEGWLRFVLDQYQFPYRTIHNEHVKFDDLRQDFDLIILPQQFPRDIMHGFDPTEFPGVVTSSRVADDEVGEISVPNPYPEKYAGGIEARGADNLRRFVEAGGMLVGIDTAAEVVVNSLRLPVENALRGLPRDDFYNPGSLVRIHTDNTHPLAYGFQREAGALFLNSPAFRLHGAGDQVATHPFSGQLLSGWMRGAEHLSGLSALLDIPVAAGRAVLFGFRPYFRAQARGTYRFLFNTIYDGNQREGVGRG